MPRRSNTEMVQLNLRVPRGHDAFWAIILELDAAGPWDLRTIDQRCNVDVTTIRDFVRRLVRGGFAAKVGTRPATRPSVGLADLYRLLKSPLETPRLARDGRVLRETVVTTLWRTMKMAKVFSAEQLAELASTPDQTVTKVRTALYLRQLADVGIVALAAPKASGQPAIYRLALNLGPKAPSVMRSSMVFDPNSRQVIGSPIAQVLP